MGDKMLKLTCPNCGAFTSFSPAFIQEKGVLVEHSDNKRTVWGTVKLRAVIPYFYGVDSYGILICQSCEEFFITKRHKYAKETDWSVVYPTPHSSVADEIPQPMKSLFEEASLCFAVEAHRGCLLVCRTVLIAVQRQQAVNNLREMVEKGLISKSLFDQADQVRLWGNTVGHEDIPFDTISKEDCEQLLAYVNALLDAIYVQPVRLATLAQKRELLKKKKE